MKDSPILFKQPVSVGDYSKGHEAYQKLISIFEDRQATPAEFNDWLKKQGYYKYASASNQS